MVKAAALLAVTIYRDMVLVAIPRMARAIFSAPLSVQLGLGVSARPARIAILLAQIRRFPAVWNAVLLARSSLGQYGAAWALRQWWQPANGEIAWGPQT